MGDGFKRDLTVLFGLCGTKRGVPQVVDPSILIAWTQLEVVGLKMLSTGQHLALFIPKPVHDNALNSHFRGAPDSPQPLVICYVFQHLGI